jgi:hypothetical protein
MSLENLDDITLTETDKAEHLQNLAKVFGILKNAELKRKNANFCMMTCNC